MASLKTNVELSLKGPCRGGNSKFSMHMVARDITEGQIQDRVQNKFWVCFGSGMAQQIRQDIDQIVAKQQRIVSLSSNQGQI